MLLEKYDRRGEVPHPRALGQEEVEVWNLDTLESKASALINSITFSPFTKLPNSDQTEPRPAGGGYGLEKAAAAPVGYWSTWTYRGPAGSCLSKEKLFTHHHRLIDVATGVQTFRDSVSGSHHYQIIEWYIYCFCRFLQGMNVYPSREREMKTMRSRLEDWIIAST